MLLNSKVCTGSKDWFIGMSYLLAKECVLKYAYDEVNYLDGVDFHLIDESFFLQESAWVVLNCGMKEAIIRNIFPRVSEIFFNWRSSRQILNNKNICFDEALIIFNNPSKIRAIISIAQFISDNGFSNVKKKIVSHGVKSLKLPYLGPVTSFHLEKNLGLDVAKPDRHLVRLASLSGYDCVNSFCSNIASMVGDSTPYVDTILWKFATLKPDYLEYFIIP